MNQCWAQSSRRICRLSPQQRHILYIYTYYDMQYLQKNIHNGKKKCYLCVFLCISQHFGSTQWRWVQSLPGFALTGSTAPGSRLKLSGWVSFKYCPFSIPAPGISVIPNSFFYLSWHHYDLTFVEQERSCTLDMFPQCPGNGQQICRWFSGLSDSPEANIDGFFPNPLNMADPKCGFLGKLM